MKNAAGLPRRSPSRHADGPRDPCARPARPRATARRCRPPARRRGCARSTWLRLCRSSTMLSMPLRCEHMGQQQAGRAAADDRDLGPRRSLSLRVSLRRISMAHCRRLRQRGFASRKSSIDRLGKRISPPRRAAGRLEPGPVGRDIRLVPRARRIREDFMFEIVQELHRRIRRRREASEPIRRRRLPARGGGAAGACRRDRRRNDARASATSSTP